MKTKRRAEAATLGHDGLDTIYPNLSLELEELNPRLTEWLIEYNFNCPHQSLDYLTPIQYIEKELAKVYSPVLPM